jgi:transcriptional regulator with PAS, ATPase and Fis domain
MKNIYQLISKISHTSVNVLIQGETGTGKSLIANLIHKNSPRADGPFIVINCGAIPSSLMESELFGYAKGAFSGASDKGYVGMVQLADHGTLFLDEIGELSTDMQKKLLQMTQEHRIMPVGGTKYKSVDFRLITATNKKLEDAVKQGSFRQDLYYRLDVVSITLPSLRERKEDILFLSLQLLEKYNRKYGKETILSEDCLDALINYSWPGNIRELQNTIERMVVISKREVIELENLPKHLIENKYPQKERDLTLKQRVESFERMIINESYARNKNTTKMAKELGIGQSSVVRKLQKYMLNISEK